MVFQECLNNLFTQKFQTALTYPTQKLLFLILDNRNANQKIYVILYEKNGIRTRVRKLYRLTL